MWGPRPIVQSPPRRRACRFRSCGTHRSESARRHSKPPGRGPSTLQPERRLPGCPWACLLPPLLSVDRGQCSLHRCAPGPALRVLLGHPPARSTQGILPAPGQGFRDTRGTSSDCRSPPSRTSSIPSDSLVVLALNASPRTSSREWTRTCCRRPRPGPEFVRTLQVARRPQGASQLGMTTEALRTNAPWKSFGQLLQKRFALRTVIRILRKAFVYYEHFQNFEHRQHGTADYADPCYAA